jgi:hypothetical protein
MKMAKKPKVLTKSEKAAATRQKKQDLALDQLGIKIKKPRKRRKPMTEEQRLAAVERLKKAREARVPSKNNSVHEDIRDLPDDHPLNPTAVKGWIKDHKAQLVTMKSKRESSDWKERLDYQTKSNYISNMETYLRTGNWLDARWGEKQEFKIQTICYRVAYDDKGNIKRNVGTWYIDMREVYTKEMHLGDVGRDSDLSDFFE